MSTKTNVITIDAVVAEIGKLLQMYTDKAVFEFAGGLIKHITAQQTPQTPQAPQAQQTQQAQQTPQTPDDPYPLSWVDDAPDEFDLIVASMEEAASSAGSAGSASEEPEDDCEPLIDDDPPRCTDTCRWCTNYDKEDGFCLRKGFFVEDYYTCNSWAAASGASRLPFDD